ncbi:MAG TPA: hypothetical protein VFJ43_04580, partial [Bacteroidia bacterium]|nr:hypothetical protein [Bacteroidia bacterium]
MKYIFLFSISLFSCLNTAADKDKKDAVIKDSVRIISSGGCPCDSSSCSNFYLFQNNYYSLDSLQALVTTVLPATDFQRCSKYKHRFAKSGGWLSDENTRDSVFYKEALFTVTKNHALLIRKGVSVKTIKLFNADLGNSNTFPTHLLKITDNGVVVMVDDDDTHYVIGKYDENGKELYKTIIEHTSITKEGNTNYYEPYLMYIGSTQHEFIFSSDPFTKKEITVVINIDNGVKTEYAFASGGIIPDEQEEKLAGLIEDRDSSMNIHM